MGRHLRYRRVPPTLAVDNEQLAHVQHMTSALRQQALIALKARTDSVRLGASGLSSNDVKWRRPANSDLITGRFSSAEDAALWERILEVSKTEGFKDAREFVQHLCLSGSKLGHWKTICSRLPQRHMESVIQRVQSKFCQYARGKLPWTEVEYIWLIALVNLYHTKRRIHWRTIGLKLGRCPRHCADRYRYLKQTGILERVTPDIIEKVVNGDELRRDVTLTTTGLSSPVAELIKKTRPLIIWDQNQIIKLESAIFEATGSRTALHNIPWTAIQKSYFPHIPVFHLAQRHYITIEAVCRLDRIQQVRNVVRYLRYLIEHHHRSGDGVRKRTDSDASSADTVASITKDAAAQSTAIGEKSTKEGGEPLAWDTIDWSWCMPWWPGADMAAFARKVLMAALRVKKDSYWRILSRKNTWQRVVLALYKALDCANFEQSDLTALCKRLILLNRLAKLGDVTQVPDASPDLVRFPPDTRIESVREFVRKQRLKDDANEAGGGLPIELERDPNIFNELWRLLGFDITENEDARPESFSQPAAIPSTKELKALRPTQSTATGSQAPIDDAEQTAESVLSELSAEEEEDSMMERRVGESVAAPRIEQSPPLDARVDAVRTTSPPTKPLRTNGLSPQSDTSPKPIPVSTPSSTPSSGPAFSGPSGFTSSSSAANTSDLGATQEYIQASSSAIQSPDMRPFIDSPTQALRSPPPPAAYLWTGGTPQSGTPPRMSPSIHASDLRHNVEPWPPPPAPVARVAPASSSPPPLILPAPIRHSPSQRSTPSSGTSPVMRSRRQRSSPYSNDRNSRERSSHSASTSSREDIITPPGPKVSHPAPKVSQPAMIFPRAAPKSAAASLHVVEENPPSDEGMMLLQMLDI